ncbi:FUSC family protein [uncultured Roseibium sp.]|uniref:FUSC family protein n=1 Tax=uncultured Roseibium sp. TaxID=1936171 RepID=UPI0026132468|nr:FUSC family protein [uncultured Roseibium sp.]
MATDKGALRSTPGDEFRLFLCCNRYSAAFWDLLLPDSDRLKGLDKKTNDLTPAVHVRPMLQKLFHTLSRLLTYDPGALRLVRGVHLMLTVLVAAALGHMAGGFVENVSGFKLAVLAAAAGAHCLIFTPVATRRQEIASLTAMAGVLVLLFSIGGLAGTLAGASGSLVLQLIWVAVIALGFALDGIGGFWQRAGRMMAICWLFVIMGSLPSSPGIWMPAMAVLGAVVAMAIRVGVWRPSTEKTYLRVEAANREAMAGFLNLAATGLLEDRQSAAAAMADLAALRGELRLCTQLLGAKPSVRGLSPENATMIELALEVVRDALAHLTKSGKVRLTSTPAFKNSVDEIAAALKSGSVPKSEDCRKGWEIPDTDLPVSDQFQILRIAQAFKRLSALSRRGSPVPKIPPAAAELSKAAWLTRLSWPLALQAGVAAAIGYGLGVYFQLSHAYWVTLTIVIVLSNTLGTTVQRTIQRSLGTAAGVVVAMAVDPLLSSVPEFRIGLVVVSIPVVIVFMERNYAVASGIISFLVVMGLQTLEDLPILELWSRLYDTLIGAGIGLGVAFVLFPKRSDTGIRALAADYLSACKDYLRTDGDRAKDDWGDFSALRVSAGKLVTTASAYRAEQAPWSSFSGAANRLDVLVIVLADYVVLYHQARTAVEQELSMVPDAVDLQKLADRLNTRILSVFDEILAERGTEIADDWLAVLPDLAGKDTDLITDWVAMLYHARKVIYCLNALKEDNLWSLAFETSMAPAVR